MRIALIGAGGMGQAVAGLLRNKKKAIVDFWDKDVSKVPDQQPLSEVVSRADFVFICVPSFAVRVVATTIAPHLVPKTLVISVSKGLEPTTHKTMDEVMREVLPAEQPKAMLCGPMLADEMMKGLPSAGVIGSTRRRVFTKLHKLFVGTQLRLEYSRDFHGVALVSVLKNIYVIGVGIGEGLGYGDNWRGWFMNQAVNEMVVILKLLGGKPATVYSSAGIGDFIATAVSPYSRNHAVGKELGATGSTTLTSEGLQSLPSLLQLVGNHVTELPLLSALQKVIIEKHHAQEIFPFARS